MRRRRKMKPIFKILVFLLILLLTFVVIDKSVSPYVKLAAETEAHAIASSTANQVLNDVLQTGNWGYEKLVTVNYLDGKVSSIESNVININRLKAEVITSLQDELLDLNHDDFSIALGTLTGSNLLAGKGPKIPLKIVLKGAVTSEVYSSFESAGINQTLHRIEIKLEMRLHTMIPAFSETVFVATNLPVAETVIVGDVPDFYAGLTD